MNTSLIYGEMCYLRTNIEIW